MSINFPNKSSQGIIRRNFSHLNVLKLKILQGIFIEFEDIYILFRALQEFCTTYTLYFAYKTLRIVGMSKSSNRHTVGEFHLTFQLFFVVLLTVVTELTNHLS